MIAYPNCDSGATCGTIEHMINAKRSVLEARPAMPLTEVRSVGDVTILPYRSTTSKLLTVATLLPILNS